MIKRLRIPNELFRQILENSPNATVDFVIVRRKRGKEKEFLLGKRLEKPYRGKYFIPGGRILWGESFEKAIARQLQRELGVKSINVKFLCNHSYVFPPNNLGVKYHSLMHVYLIKISVASQIKPNKENIKIGWFSKIDPSFPLPTRKILQKAGFTI